MASAPIYFQSLYYHTFQRILFLHSVGFILPFAKYQHTIYGKEGRKALWVCRETHDENPKDRCIQVKEYRGHGTLCILEVRGGGGDGETALS